MRRAVCLLLGAATLALAGCSGSDSTPDFTPSPAGPVEGSGGIHVDPALPLPATGSSSAAGRSGGSGSSGSTPSTKPTDSLVVATRLRAPVGLALLPDGTALVGERTTGRIVRVQPKAGMPVLTVRTLTGLDTAGDGGLLDLAVSPDYSEDNLIYAYVSTRTDNRVVDFTLHGPVTPVLTGIPHGRTDDTGRIAFSADGSLYVGTGDGGVAARAARPASLGGKVLRISQIGTPDAGNPRTSSPVFSSGHRVVNGLCAVPETSLMLEVETRADGRTGVVNLLTRGAYYGWPTSNSATRAPIAVLPKADGAPGGCAVLGGRIWVTSLDGHALLSAPLSSDADGMQAGAFVAVLKNRYGRLKTVVAATDQALWITTSNRDGHGTPVRADERVIRYVPSNDNGGVGRTA